LIIICPFFKKRYL